MATGLAIRDELVDWGLVFLGVTSAASGSATHITDTVLLQSNALSSNSFDGCIVRLTSGARAGDQVRVDYLDTANGILYVSPNFGGTPAISVTYEIWRAGINPDDVDRMRDKALTEKCSVWALQPLSEIPNADFEDALSSSNWEGTGSALAIQTLSFPSEFVRNSVLLTNNSTNDYCESASLYVRPGQVKYLYVPVSVRSGTAEVIVRDITNGQNVSLNGTATAVGRGWTGIELTFQIPTDCYEITVRLVGQESTAVTEWGPVHYTGQLQKAIGLPSRITNRGDVGPLYRVINPMEVGASIDWGEDDIEEVPGIKLLQIRDSVQLRYPPGLIEAPHFFAERIFYDALSSAYTTVAGRTAGDAATTECPVEYVVPAMAYLLCEQYMFKNSWERDFWQNLFQRANKDFSRVERRFGPLPKPRQERARSIYVYEADV